MTSYFSRAGFSASDYPVIDPRSHTTEVFTEGEVIRLPKGIDNYLKRVYLDKPWQQIMVVDLTHRHPSSAESGISEFAVTFSGGSPSAIPGWHGQFATRPPFDEDFHRHVGVERGEHQDPRAARRREHEGRIKALIKPLRGWQMDSTVDESRTMGGSWLETFQCVEALPFSTTYRLVVRSPWMD